jgi:hypothetical protein
VALGLALPALDLAGAPLSSGALAKISLTMLVAQSPWGATWLPAVLSIAAIGSTLLMISFLRRALAGKTERLVPGAGLFVPWALLLGLDLVFLVNPPVAAEELTLLVLPGKLWSAAWPVAAGVAIAAAARFGPRVGTVRLRVPPGDVLALIDLGSLGARRGLEAARAALARSPLGAMRTLASKLRRSPGRLPEVAARAEASLATFETIGVLFVFLTLLAAAVLWGR